MKNLSFTITLLFLLNFGLNSCTNQHSLNPIENNSELNSATSDSEIPKSGTYIYTVQFAEHQGMFSKDAVTIIIDNKNIKVINNGILSGTKGEIIDQGIIMKHKDGQYIIAHHENDIFAEEIGGCSDGPLVIKFSQKIIVFC